jgi:hypothetical protein
MNRTREIPSEQRFLVNLNFLEKYISHDSVILHKSNVSVPIAQQRLSSFLAALGKFSY